MHCPLEPQTPLTQLQLDGRFVTAGVRQIPVPEIPWSHLAQFDGQGWHLGPKKPCAHDSHEEPVKPVGQVHVPFAEHTPLPEQDGVHDDDWMSRIESAPVATDWGSWETSGTELQKTMRLEPDCVESQTFDDRANDCEVIGVEELPTGDVGRGAKFPLPLYNDWE